MPSIRESPYLENIFTAIETGKCLPFLGAGASTAYEYGGKTVPGIPLAGAFTKMFNDHCGLNGSGSKDFTTAAEHVVLHNNGDRAPLEKIFKDQIKPFQNQPRPIHTAIASIPQIRDVITTNYDPMLEVALQRVGRTPSTHVHRQFDNNTGNFDVDPETFDEGEMRLHKMHGSWDQPSTMIATRSDYIRYLTRLNDPAEGMPEYFRKTRIPRRNLLFLGYSVSDWNFLVIWEGMMARQQTGGVTSTRNSFAIMYRCDRYDTEFLARRNIKVIEGDLTEFACLLAERFKFEIPQIDFKPPAAGGAP